MKLTKEEFKKLIFEDENSNTDADKENSANETKTEANPDESPEKQETSAEKKEEVKKETPNLNKVLEVHNWKKLPDNDYQLTTDKYIYVIHIPTTNESQFIKLVRKLILEDTAEKIQVKIYEPGKNPGENKEVGTYKIDYTTDYTQIENELKKIVKDIDSKKDDKKEETQEKHILDIINSAYDKLTDEEKNAFDEIYGEKLAKALKN